MASTRDFKQRIRSVKNTQQITRAMKLVAASKVRRCQERIENARPYSDKISELVNSLSLHVDQDAHPLLKSDTDDQKVLLIVITSDRGLCGGYNTNLLREGMQFLQEREAENKETLITVIGNKGREFFSRRNYTFKDEFPDVYGQINFSLAETVSDLLVQSFLDNEIGEVHLLTTEFKSVISQQPTITRLLPLSSPVPEGIDEEGEPVVSDYIFEPSLEEVLIDILPKHINAQVYRALLDAEASEFGSRMIAMDNASRNAEEMIGTLTLQMNRVRQASITTELLEVVSGADALAG